jgi:serine protease Do
MLRRAQSSRLALASLLLVATACSVALGFRAADDGRRGRDRFDTIGSVDELRTLEQAIVEVAARARPAVVLLRTAGPGRGGTGTGVIISPDGLVATCGHVGRRPGRRMTAVLADGTELRGTTLGQVFDGPLDMGLVQLEVGDTVLPSLELGTTEGLEAGDWVVSLGFTHGLDGPPRPALVRAGRVLSVAGAELYTDAPIDAGDSGGPVVDLDGRVVGLNARCGRQSWQNVATRAELLAERLDVLRDPDAANAAEDADGEEGDALPEPRRGARFPDHLSDGKASIERTAPLDEVAAAASAATVLVRGDGRTVGFGTIVQGDGIVAAKASQLDGITAIEVEREGGSSAAAEIIARDPASDVALLRMKLAPEEQRPTPIRWAIDASLAPGSMVVVPRAAGARSIVGFTAIESLDSRFDDGESPFLGVQSRNAAPPELRRAGADRAVVVQRVVPNSAASRAGLRAGQMVLAVDGVEIGSPVELRGALRRHAPGATVRLTIVEGEAADEVDVVLGRRSDSEGAVRRGNTTTPISRRSTGLGAVFAHDAVLRPDEMGGPIVDLEGRAIGFNIARFDRTATHVLGAARIAEIVERLLAESAAPSESTPAVPAS